jgi:hypothetical protein
MTTLAVFGLGGWEILLILFVLGSMAVAVLLTVVLILYLTRNSRRASQGPRIEPQPPVQS